MFYFKESSDYVLLWICTIIIGIAFTTLIAYSYTVASYIMLGIFFSVIANLSSVTWICVVIYYFQLNDENNRRLESRLELSRDNETRTISTVVATGPHGNETPPPPYNMIYKDAVLAPDENDKPPTYEESTFI